MWNVGCDEEGEERHVGFGTRDQVSVGKCQFLDKVSGFVHPLSFGMRYEHRARI
jgi:hypothetical protein